MATDPQDKVRLDVAAKAVQARTSTSQAKQLWQESFDRNPALLAARSVAAAKAINGLAGSWTAFTELGYAVEDAQGTLLPAHDQAKVNKIGQPGLPEINFVPYNWRTNRFGTKGPSLLGHPISFSVVGPTLKSPYCDWQWYAIDNSAAPASGDILRIIDDESVLGNPAPYATTLAEAYNLSDLADFPNGLYVVLAQTGEPGVLLHPGDPDEAGGLSDGLYVASGGSHAPLVALTPWSKYEIFRVIALEGTKSLRLDPGKRLASYFTFPAVGQPTVRAITLVTPYLTRLQAVPGSGPLGQEQAFLTLTPPTSAGSDFRPPYKVWATGTGFDPTEPTSPYSGVASAEVYGETLPLPVPMPYRSGTGTLLAPGDAGLPTPKIGLLPIRVDDINLFLDMEAFLLRIYAVEAPLGTLDGGGVAPLQAERFLGWFSLYSANIPQSTLHLARVTEVDPETGTPFFGGWNQELTETDNAAHIRFTLHWPVETLYSNTSGTLAYSADMVDSARLTTLIDPSWVERSTKAYIPPFTSPSDPEPSPSLGSRAERADKAIFDTTPSSDPGNLLDLGFRMVLYPAKTSGYTILPDMDQPIVARDVVLDPTISEPQWIDIDYSAGVVRLSHPPKPGAGCAVDPNNVAADGVHNPRGTIILFAACVPYSMEPGQLDSAVRVTGTSSPEEPVACEDAPSSDVYSHRLVLPLAAQTVTCGNVSGNYLDLDYDDYGKNLIPQTGFVELLKDGSLGSGGEAMFVDSASCRQSTFGYTAKARMGSPGAYFTRLLGLYGGGVDGDTYAVTAAASAVAVVRRDTASPTYYKTLVEYQQDVTYGSAKRSSTLHFEDTEVVPQLDGSLVVSPQAGPRAEALMSDLFRNWLLTGGELTFILGGGPPFFTYNTTFNVDEAYLLVRGKRVRVPSVDYDFTSLTTDTHYYVYYDVSGGCPVLTVQNVPLSQGADAILIASFVRREQVAPPAYIFIDTIIDLRNPLWKIDERFELLVGSAEGQDCYHFETLGAAVAYANEIMTPTLGDAGYSLTIRVVGTTTETGLITLHSDGIAVVADALRGVAVRVSWTGTGPLINLNGHDRLVFRNLYFFRDVPTAPDAHLFENTGLSDCAVIDNCEAQGNWTSLFYAASDLVDVGLRYSRITNCVVGTPGDNLVRIEGTHGVTEGLLLDNNVGRGGLGAVVVNTEATVRGNTCGDILCTSSCLVENSTCTTISVVGLPGDPGTVLRGNTVTGLLPSPLGTVAILLNGGDRHQVNSNRLAQGDLSVVSGSGHDLVGNICGTTGSSLIEVAATATYAVIRDNRIAGRAALIGPIRDAIVALGDDCRVSGNTTALECRIVVSGDRARVSDNQSGMLIVGDEGIVDGNQVLVNVTTGDLIQVGTGCTVTGNRALGVTQDGTLNPATDSDPDVNGTTVVGNRFSSATGIFGLATAYHGTPAAGVLALPYGHNSQW